MRSLPPSLSPSLALSDAPSLSLSLLWKADIAAADDAKKRLEAGKEEETKAKTKLRLLQEELHEVMNNIITEQVSLSLYPPPPSPSLSLARSTRS
jgi:hypothetical protein